MRKISASSVIRTAKIASRYLPNSRLTRILGGILFLILLQSPIQVLAAVAPPASYSAPLTWDPNPDPGVAGYRVYYGTASGIYLGNVDVGNTTTNNFPGLASGITYFFAVTCYTANGLESALSNEISFLPGLPLVRILGVVGEQVVLTVKGLIGHTYEILATEDLTAWTVIGNVTLGLGGSASFTHTNGGSFSKRFYRTRDTLP